MSNKTMKSVSGHVKDEEVARYVESANQAALAESAIAQLVAWEMSNPVERLDNGEAEVG